MEGAAFRTPPHKLGLTEMPLEAVGLLAEVAAGLWDALPAVLGPETVGVPFAKAWHVLRGQDWRPGEAQRIYRLDRVEHAPEVGGRVRVAEAGDAALVEAWATAFAQDLGQEYASTTDAQRSWIRNGDVVIWDDPADKPVAMAVGRGHTAGGARVGYVYTVPEARGHGYGSAIVAALSQRLLDGGCDFSMLYALASNPVTNRIYQRIGYRYVAEVRDIVFD